MKPINRLLRKNMSPGRIAGFVISNFLGLAIIMGALQFWNDARSLWTSDSSFVKSDYLVLNKRVSASSLWDGGNPVFSSEEFAELRRQPWVRRTGAFTATDYKVWASVSQGGRGMSTMMFFESVPDEFVDAAGPDWHFQPGDKEVPVIIPKEYLALYNFGFAGSAGLPQMSESVMSGIPLGLDLVSDDGLRRLSLSGHIAGFSDRLNTILVPQSFMDWSNAQLGSSNADEGPSRVIVDVSSPGDVAIGDYLESHGLEVAGDKANSSAAYLLNLVVGIVVAVGGVITLMSFLILLLSVSLLMEKNRTTVHQLLFLGFGIGKVSRPYTRLVVLASLSAWVLAAVSCVALRAVYSEGLRGLGASGGDWVTAPLAGLGLTAVLAALNVGSVRRRVKKAWRLN